MLLQKLLNLKKTRPADPGPRIIQVPIKQAGIHVDHDTALRYSAVFACVRVISESIACLPWHVYEDQGDRKEKAKGPIEYLLNKRPNPELSSFSFKRTLLGWALTWGNGYAEIERDNAGRPIGLWPIAPDRVEVKRDAETGQVYYEVYNSRDAKSIVDPRNMFHVHGLGYDGLVGYSVISLSARNIGLGLAAEDFGASFFGNGAQLGGVIKVPNGSRLSTEAKAAMYKAFNSRHQGTKNAFKVEILDGDADYKEIGIPPEDAQMIETRGFNVEDICRWFRVPPHKVAKLDHATFTNIEHQSLEFVTDTLGPWIKCLEEEADYKLFGLRNTRYYTKLNVNALLRGDMAGRAAYFRDMWNLGVLSVNEIRALEDLNPVPDGEKRFVQLNMTTLEKAGEQPEPAQAEPPATDGQGDELDENGITNVLRYHIKTISAKLKPMQSYPEMVGYLAGYKPEIVNDLGEYISNPDAETWAKKIGRDVMQRCEQREKWSAKALAAEYARKICEGVTNA